MPPDRPSQDGPSTAVLERSARRPCPAMAFLQLEPSAVCDLHCRMCMACYRRDIRGVSSPFLSVDAFRRLLAELPDLATLHLQGLGEPFLHPQFLQMVREASDLRIRTATNTNMRQVHAKRAAECIESGLDTLCVSLDSPDPRTYESIRGANLRDVVENLRVLLKLREQAGAQYPKVVLVAVLMRSTLLQLPGLVRLATSLGVDGVAVQNLAQRLTEPDLPAHFGPLRRHVWQESLRPKDVPLANKVFATARAMADYAALDLKLPALRPKHVGRPACEWPWTAMYVTFSGETVPCCMIGLPERVNVGNVFREGAMNIWSGPKMQVFRDRLASDQPPDVCLGCSVYRREF